MRRCSPGSQNVCRTSTRGGSDEPPATLGAHPLLGCRRARLSFGRRLTHLEDISGGDLSITGVPASWQPELPVNFTLAAGDRRLCVIGCIGWRRGDAVGVAFSGGIPGHSQRVMRFTRALLEELS